MPGEFPVEKTTVKAYSSKAAVVHQGNSDFVFGVKGSRVEQRGQT